MTPTTVTILTSPISSDNNLHERLNQVRRGISEACAAAGRSDDEITLIAVTKFHPVSLVRELISLGVSNFGESRHQEAAPKAAALTDQQVTWHFVGQVQTKKARRVSRYAQVIHSVDRRSLLDALSVAESDEPLPDTEIFLQVNLTDDPLRGGVGDLELEPLAEYALGTQGVRVRGVMAVAPRNGDPARAFEQLHAASQRVQALDHSASAISAGMSGDYPTAIAWGATHLRIGSAITEKTLER